MPGWYEEDYGMNLYPLRSAWRDHYVAKGCNHIKAWSLALKKTHTWPPK